MTPSRPLRAIAALFLAAAPVAVFAHTGHDHSLGLLNGLAHPLNGLDHLLAMLAVGLWAWRSGGKARWALPAAFVGLMLMGALMATGGIGLPMVEGGILASVVALGLLTAFGMPLPVLAGSVLVGLFGLFHGYAHGLEAGLPGSFAAYALGFAAATAALHGAGLALGRWVFSPSALRMAGAGVAVAGVALALV